MAMRCPVCEALERERSLMNQIEANTVLQQRYKMILPPVANGVDAQPDQDLDEVIRFSRKYQAKIAFRLQRHQDREHAA
jgi:hypothetical protein